ncbi:MAG: sensor histidine kinase [Lachnospiraceae bacterium]|jgi:two-component system phosphate regulon sensor histidine kinase PhoR
MKNKFSYLLIPMFIILFYAAAVWYGNYNMITLDNGGAAVHSAHSCYHLSGSYDTSANTYYYSVQLPASHTRDLELALVNPGPFSIDIKTKTASETVYSHPSSAQIRNYFVRIPLTSEYYDEEGTSLSFSIHSPSFITPYCLLGNSSYFQNFSNIRNLLRVFLLGELSLLLLYNLNLYLHKRSETYLKCFFLYLLVLFLWEGILLLPFEQFSAPAALLTYFSDTIYLLITCMSALICWQLTQVSLPSQITDFLRWYSLVGACVFFQIFNMLGFSIISQCIRLAYSLLGLWIVLHACMQKKAGAIPLLIGYSCFLLQQPFPAIYAYQYLTGDFIISLLQASHAFFVPLALSGMNLVLTQFAQAFTDASQAYDQLQKLNQTLDQKVTERTREIMTHQEEERYMMLNIFHDLRSPLFIIKEYINLLETDYDSAKAFIPALKDRISYLHQLTEDLFLIAKLEKETVFFNEESLSLPSLLYQICKPYQVECRSKSITFNLNQNGESYIWGDKTRLNQAFSNLLGNAVTHTPYHGTITVTSRITKETNTAVITFFNTGIAIPKENLDKLFLRYYSYNRTDAHSHTGLGLSIAYEIIQHHNGTIMVDSHEESGTTFTVTLPLHTPAQKYIS